MVSDDEVDKTSGVGGAMGRVVVRCNRGVGGEGGVCDGLCHRDVAGGETRCRVLGCCGKGGATDVWGQGGCIDVSFSKVAKTLDVEGRNMEITGVCLCS